MYWIYVLETKNRKRYIGYTRNLKHRLTQHQRGRVFSTHSQKPLKLIYVEGCLNKEDAMRRERYLKTTGGRRFLAKRLKTYYKDE